MHDDDTSVAILGERYMCELVIDSLELAAVKSPRLKRERRRARAVAHQLWD